ncbi:DUF2341 domain-containing protein [Thermococcus sp.]
MGSLKKIITAIMALVILASTLVGLAVPNIVLRVQEIGEGSQPIVSPVCSGGFYPVQDGIKVQLGSDLPRGSKVYVILYDSNGNPVASNYTEFSDGLPANTPFIVHFNSTAMNSASFSKTRVVVYDGYSQNVSTGTVDLYVQKMSVGNWSGEYAQPINITYNGSKTLHGWPVKIVLSNNNPENPYGSGYYYIYWPVLQNNIQSIHFVDSQGHLLYYWVEIFHPGTYPNYDDAYAVIWVNVTDIPPGGTKIWMIYGSGDYSQYNNGKRVFWFFDDFESPSLASDGWSLYNPSNNGSRLADFGFGYHSYRSFDKFNYFDRQDGAVKNLPSTLPRGEYNITLEYWDYRKNLTRGALDRVGIVDGSGNGFGAVMRAMLDGSTINYIRVDTRVNYVGTTHSGTGFQPPVIYNNTWYLMRLNIFTNGSIEVQIFNQTGYLQGEPMGEVWYLNDTKVDFSKVYIKGGSAYYVDGMRIRFTQRAKPEAKVDEWYASLVFHPGCYVPETPGETSTREYIIPVTIHNSTDVQSSKLLPAYVVNFTYRLNPSDYTNVYVTDANGRPLYYWYYYQPQTGITWFWVNVTAYNTSKTEVIYVHLNGTSYDSTYFDPARVFWYFESYSTPLVLDSMSNYTLDYSLSRIVIAGYNGTVADMDAALNMSTVANWVGPFWTGYSEQFFGSTIYLHGVGILGNLSAYPVLSPDGSYAQQYGTPGGVFSPALINRWAIYSITFNDTGGVSLYGDGDLLAKITISKAYRRSTLYWDYLNIGQYEGGPSSYSWVGLRPYSYYAPTVTVGTLQPISSSTLSTVGTSTLGAGVSVLGASSAQEVPKK